MKHEKPDDWWFKLWPNCPIDKFLLYENIIIKYIEKKQHTESPHGIIIKYLFKRKNINTKMRGGSEPLIMLKRMKPKGNWCY